MGSAAPLVQPVEPGQTVPGAAPSSKFSNVYAPPLTVTAATSCPRAADEGAMRLSQDVTSRIEPNAIAPRGRGRWFTMSRLRHGKGVDVYRGRGKIRTPMLRPGNARGGRSQAWECGGRATSRVAAPQRCE